MQSTKATRLFRAYSGVGTILMFHSVNPKKRAPRLDQNAGLEITPAQLEEIILLFKSLGYEAVSLDKLVDNLGKEHATKQVVFTFDDGYKNNLMFAYPVFKKHTVPFTIYITGKFAEQTLYPFWYALEDALFDNQTFQIRLNGQLKEFPCANYAAKSNTYDTVFEALLGEGIQDSKTLKGLFNYKEEPDFMLTWDDIKFLNKDPLVTIGAHTMTHPVLMRLCEDEARREISESKKLIETRIQAPVNHFCYPFGFQNKVSLREFNIAKELGFKSAVTTRKANVFPGHREHLHALPRIPISGLHQGPYKNYLDAFLDGMLPCLHHKFKKVVTH